MYDAAYWAIQEKRTRSYKRRRKAPQVPQKLAICGLRRRLERSAALSFLGRGTVPLPATPLSRRCGNSYRAALPEMQVAFPQRQTSLVGPLWTERRLTMSNFKPGSNTGRNGGIFQ